MKKDGQRKNNPPDDGTITICSLYADDGHLGEFPETVFESSLITEDSDE